MTSLQHALRSRTATVAAAAAAAAIAATLVQARPAAALPPAQAICDMSTIAITAARGWVPLSAPITVTTPNTEVKAEVTADVGVDAGAEVRLGWEASNSLQPLEGQEGPANFANHQEFFETRTAFMLTRIVGTTVIQPFVRVNGPATARATLLHRCFTVEDATS